MMEDSRRKMAWRCVLVWGLGAGGMGCSVALDTDELREQDIRRDAATDSASDVAMNDGGVDSGPMDAGPDVVVVVDANVDVGPDCSMRSHPSPMRITTVDEDPSLLQLVFEEEATEAHSYTVLAGGETIPDVVLMDGTQTASFTYRTRLFQDPFVVRDEVGCEDMVTDFPSHLVEAFTANRASIYSVPTIYGDVGSTDIANDGTVVFAANEFLDEDEGVFQWDMDGTFIQAVSDSSSPAAPRISDDGRLIIYWSSRDDRFHSVFDAGTDEARRGAFGSPTGERNAEVRGDAAGYHIVIPELRDDRNYLYYGLFTLADVRAGALSFGLLPVMGISPFLHTMAAPRLAYVGDGLEPIVVPDLDMDTMAVSTGCALRHPSGRPAVSETHVAFVGGCDEVDALWIRPLDGMGETWSLPLEGELRDVRVLLGTDENLETLLIRSDAAYWVVLREDARFTVRRLHEPGQQATSWGFQDGASLSPDGRWASFTILHSSSERFFLYRVRVR